MLPATSGSSGEQDACADYPTSQWFQESSVVPVRLALLLEETRCSICYGRIKKARVSMGCLHRYCTTCIEQSLRTEGQTRRADRTEKQQCPVCPVCRYPLPSRRATRPDPNFDVIITALYGDVNSFDEEEDNMVAEANKSVIAEQQRKMTELRTSILNKPKPKPGRPKAVPSPKPAAAPPGGLSTPSSVQPPQLWTNRSSSPGVAALPAKALPYTLVSPIWSAQRPASVVRLPPPPHRAVQSAAKPSGSAGRPLPAEGGPRPGPPPAKKSRIGTLVAVPKPSTPQAPASAPAAMQGGSVPSGPSKWTVVPPPIAALAKAVPNAQSLKVEKLSGDVPDDTLGAPDRVVVCLVPAVGSASSSPLVTPYLLCSGSTSVRDIASVVSQQLSEARGSNVASTTVRIFLHSPSIQSSTTTTATNTTPALPRPGASTSPVPMELGTAPASLPSAPAGASGSGACVKPEQAAAPPPGPSQWQLPLGAAANSLSPSMLLGQLEWMHAAPLVLEFMTVGTLKVDSRAR